MGSAMRTSKEMISTAEVGSKNGHTENSCYMPFRYTSIFHYKSSN